MPSTPRKAEAGTPDASTLRACLAATSVYSRQPSWCRTTSPSANAVSRDATTSPTAPPQSALPISYGAA